MKLPFYANPLNWGLRGKAKLEARAHHALSGMDLALELTRIHHLDPVSLSIRDERKYQEDVLIIRHNYQDITEEEFDRQMVEFLPENEREQRRVDLDLRYGKINEATHERITRTLKGEPWVGCVDDGYDAKKGINGYYFKLDWNEYFPKMLRENGYSGSDEEMVEQWWIDVTREVREEFIPTRYQPTRTRDGSIDVYS